MEKIIIKERLRAISEANGDLSERMKDWDISYNKKADMVTMGGTIPEGTYYIYADEDGAMIRVDEQNRIYGFAIENATYFKKKHPEVAFALNFVMYPTRTRFITIPFLACVYHTKLSIDKMRGIFAVADYVQQTKRFAW